MQPDQQREELAAIAVQYGVPVDGASDFAQWAIDHAAELTTKVGSPINPSDILRTSLDMLNTSLGGPITLADVAGYTRANSKNLHNEMARLHGHGRRGGKPMSSRARRRAQQRRKG